MTDLSGNASFIILYMILGYFFHSLHFSSHKMQNNANNPTFKFKFIFKISILLQILEDYNKLLFVEHMSEG